MKALNQFRLAALRVAVAALILLATVCAFVSASSLPRAGNTGKALALRSALHPEASKARIQALLAAGHWSHFANGRYMADPKAFGLRPMAASNTNSILVNEAVQTFDVFAPGPSFAPTSGTLTPTDLTPVWTAGDDYVIFSSTRAGDGHYHLFAIPAQGGAAVQLTTGSGDEFYPALNKSNSVLAFTSSANSTNQDLYVINFQTGVAGLAQNPVNPASLDGNAASSLTLGDSGIFTNVTRPTLSPAGDQIVFSATTAANTSGLTPNVPHLYYLYVATHGYDPSQTTPPAPLTNGPAADTDPAWSPKGDFIVFASTATGFNTVNNQLSPTAAPTVSQGTGAGRGLFLLNAGTTTAVGTVPSTLASAGGRVDLTGSDDAGPAWSADLANQYTNPNANVEYIAFERGATPTVSVPHSPHDIFYYRLTTNGTGGTNTAITISPEAAGNAAVKLNTDDNAGETSANGNVYDDLYPTWSQFLSVFSIAYQSPRSITYNTSSTTTDGTNENLPLEVAVSIPQGATNYGANNVGPSYTGILESQVLNLDPPTLLRYDGTEVVRITDENGVQPSGRFIQPGRTVKLTVRLSNREAGIDPHNVYVQIKDPDSKYQDSQGLEHKVFARGNENPGTDPHSGDVQAPNPFDYRADSGSASARLFNGGANIFTYGPTFAGFNIINSIPFDQFGSVGGTDGSDTIGVGHSTTQGSAGTASYYPWGPEYECQYVNPTVANPGTSLGDYGTPFYLAGVDDQVAFSGSANPARPVTNTPAANNNAATFAEWLPLTIDATQDNQGGVLYSATYTTPSSPSDFYVDVIAYDNAAFPALPTGTSTYIGQSKNWRIYDNVGGFTTQSFDGSNDILVVSDYALGQKFSATTFGGQNGNSNLQPTFYGAESYYTDVDESLLPNATDIWSQLTAPTAPAVPAQQNTSAPTNVVATPANGSVVLTWAGDNQPTYNVYRTTDQNATFPAGYTKVGTVGPFNPATGTVATTLTDSTVTNGTTFFYLVTSVDANGNESLPSPGLPGAKATPLAFGSVVHSVDQFSAGGGSLDTFPDVLNGLGVGSYVDGINDDGSRVSVITTDPISGATQNANLPDGSSVVPYVKSQKYSLWRILCRGPITTSVLNGYQPGFQSQPAVNDAVNGVTAVAADGATGDAPLVPVAQRCVIWVAPYSGNLPLVDSGSIENPTTQQTLEAYLNQGGRLCLTGANVASALSLKGTGDPNTAGTGAAFLSTYLGAKFASQAGGGQILGAAGDRLSGNAGFNGDTEVYPLFNSNGTITNVPPSQQGSLLLGNDFDNTPNWRTDASLDQLGPNLDVSLTQGQGGRDTIEAVAQINTITPNTGVTQDMTTNGAAGLIYHENYTSAVGSGYGSRVVFGSFGLEGISIDYYKTTVGSAVFYTPRNQRPNILHNIVDYLRTGTFIIHVTQASGQGVPGATVYLRPNGGTLPGPRQVFSANDPLGVNTAGNYTISGVEPGSYTVVAYKSGFTTTVSNSAFSVEGDTTNSTGLVIAPVPPGRIQGTVKDNAGNPVAGATVTFKSTDGQITYTVTSAADGTYKVDPAAVGTYNGTASKKPQYADATAPTQGNPITVPSGGTSEADFVLQAQPASVSGTVFVDANGNGILDNGETGVAGAIVTFTPTTGTALTATTNASGVYSFTGIAPGTYKITVTANGYQAAAAQSITVQPGDAITGRNIPVVVVPPTPPGYLGGLVDDSYTGQPLAGVTITVTDSTGKQVAQVLSTGTTATGASPQGDGQPVNYGPISLPPGQYSVTATLAGFGTQSLSNLTVVSNAFTRADFTSANGNPLQPLHVFPAGYNFFSVPYDYAAAGVTIDQIFGTLNTGTRAAPSTGSNRSHVFVWSPVLLQYLLDPTPPADGLHLGQGYWIYLTNPSEVKVTGNLPTTTTIPVGLNRGWNQIGVPSLSAVSVSRITFANPTGGGTISFADASSSTYHLVSPTLYGYNGTSYVSLTTGGTLQTWQSYWIYAYADTTILLPTGGG